jgi:DNA-binding NtrC family response regulator
MKNQKKIVIFIVEDNKVFAQVMKTDIESAFVTMPVEIHLFENGEKCMTKLKELKPQVVILDYHLDSKISGSANGIQVLDRIKSERSETNVIMMTSDDNIEIALKSFKHGASDYIVKTDTQFRKIIYTMFNLLRVMEARKDAVRYKYIAVASVLFVALVIGGVVVIQMFNPALLSK